MWTSRAPYAARASRSLLTCATACPDGRYPLARLGGVERDWMGYCSPLCGRGFLRMGLGGARRTRLLNFRPRVSVSAHDVATRLYYGDCLWTGVSGCDRRYRSAAPCSMGADTGDCDCLPDAH